MTKVEQKYISIGCNRTSNTADINDEGLMAFGGGRYVCLWNPNDEHRKGIYSTLIGHESDVSIVKFIQKGYGSSGILSGDSKGQSIIWRRQSNGHYAIGCKLENHQRSISAIGTLKAPKVNDQSDELVVTGGSDSVAKVFKINDKNESKLCQTIDLNNKFPLDITLSYLPQSQTPIMALTLTNNRIEIYIWNESEESFYKTLSLEGHEDWVRSLSFATLPTAIIDGKFEPETVLLASGSQDGYIRLWAIKRNSIDKQNEPKVDEVKPSSNTLNASLLDEFERKLQEGDGGAMDSKSLSTKVHIINDKNTSKEYKLNFEALLLGHDSWVTGLHWHPPQFEKDLKSFTQPQYLLSASADKSMILWSPQSGLWTNERRFGEFGTGGLGFFGGLWSPDGQHVFAHGLNGSVHRWKKDNQSGLWNPELAITGHGGPVKDVEWDPCYEYFLSASIDQTTRLHGPWIRSGIESWHELCRPQSHGYDMQSLTFIGKDQFKFASAADEKIVRLFDAPRGWIKTAKGLGVTKSQVNEIDRPLGASLPPMSLSNRVLKDNDEENVQSTNEGEGKDWTSSNFYGENLQQAPVEEQLVTTLWPESNKLFGHGYELFSASSAHHSSLIATACKAQSPKHAVIRVTDANKATSFGEPLEGHTLTVTNIDWSPDDRLILSVSRDRTWRLFEREQNGFKPIAADKSHARIIWDCSFSTDGKVFGTASRDKTVRIWHRDNELSNEKWSAKSVLKFDGAATAISFSQTDKMLAVGLENGHIEILKTHDYIEWTNVITLTDISDLMFVRLFNRPSQVFSARLIHTMSNIKEVYIASASRTPIASINGGLATLTAPQLGVVAVKKALESAGISADKVEELYFGQVLQGGCGQSPARQVALGAGLPDTVDATTINKVCASGMKSVALAAQSIALGERDVVVAGGMESMSNAPYYLPRQRPPVGHQQATDSIMYDGLWDIYNNFHMGNCAESAAKKFNVTREEQDAYAIESYRRSEEAWKNGKFEKEIAPVTVKTRKGDIIVKEDEEYKKILIDKVPTLKPAFQKEGGTVTPANASTLNDGASALILISKAKAEELGVKPIAKIISTADAAMAPIDFPIAPTKALPIALEKANVKINDISRFEINEAFSAVSKVCEKALGLDPSKVNVNGGAVSLGHPIGNSGARIVVTLLHQLEAGQKGAAAVCNGGGAASALVVERV